MNILLDSITDFKTLEKAACKLGLMFMEKAIAELEKELFKNKSEYLKVIGFRTKRIATKLGEIKIRRRLYKYKGKKQYIFLLDKKLGIRKGRRVSGEYLKLLVILASKLSYRQVSEVLEESGFPSLSHATIHNEV